MLGDENLLEAFQTIFGVTLNTNGSIDTNASIVSRLMPMSDLTDPTKLKQLTERFYRPVHAPLWSGRPRRLDAADRELERHDDDQLSTPRRRS